MLVSQNLGPSLPLSPIDQVSPGFPCSSPGRARSRSPLSPPPTEGFNWPDVRELRTKYSDHSCSKKSAVGRSHSIPEQMFDGGLRRHSSYSSSLLLSDAASGEVPPCNPLISQDERCQRLYRANSLDPRLSGTEMSKLQKLQCHVANYGSYYVAAEAPLSNDPEHKIIVMEKLPESESEKTTKESKEEDDDAYVQIRSPTSREKISIMAVIDRCRAYQESDEYKQREDVKAKREPVRPQELDVMAASSDDHTLDHHQESQKTKMEAGQQNIVKNLREKFQSLS
ncbi:hypothetical protein PAMP_014668 [Pampus punctatissimus]